MQVSTILKRLKGFKTVWNTDGARNQFVVKFTNGSLFMSYSSVIAVIVNDKTYLSNHWDYSNTTGKYRNIYLAEDKKETEKKIESGEYTILEGSPLI